MTQGTNEQLLKKMGNGFNLIRFVRLLFPGSPVIGLESNANNLK
jgi:hypothetical protein